MGTAKGAPPGKEGLRAMYAAMAPQSQQHKATTQQEEAATSSPVHSNCATAPSPAEATPVPASPPAPSMVADAPPLPGSKAAGGPPPPPPPAPGPPEVPAKEVPRGQEEDIPVTVDRHIYLCWHGAFIGSLSMATHSDGFDQCRR